MGCCDASKNKHATKHYHTTGHPIIENYPSASWRWCYVDEMNV
ncbi:MAG TPA: UBP-type zinc finger domain-containing protein [Ktedonobacterales bacterium]|nr:UBP-type zinc finger domain-containing protein [Ktedonobacterales bacterium]